MTKRVILGRLPSGNYGLLISKPGYDVTTNPVDNERLLFSSDWTETVPIFQSGSFTSSSSPTTITFPTLGFVPFVLFYKTNGYLDINGGGTRVYGTSFINLSAGFSISIADGSFTFPAASGHNISYKVLLVRAK